MAIIPGRLRALRKKHQLTQAELGARVNVTKVSISGYETGNRTPDTDTLNDLANVFGVTTDYLLGRVEHPTPPFLYEEALTTDEANLLREHLEFLRYRANKRDDSSEEDA
ncbi:helix-turn-helix domain-containing protein [Shouchella lonarensis]|uniref:Transcriptional regulator, contains XRE-family HTH domain n=1 Tax=Shouchella lonarensis TaxID=1464122 RepID=A0A1G6LEU9_9BACI|nr:helix-turn-helix transcriptional regulator [Shouchella lonarensis]SDC41942.1 Transcriptional regulator, contains XRE-family HTH domain [Shouchella lonarensis]